MSPLTSSRGWSLIELILALGTASLLLVLAGGMHTLTAGTYTELRNKWYCLQSLRNSLVHISRDMNACGYLLPRDLRVTTNGNDLFVAGVPVTSAHSGLHVPTHLPPPCSALVQSLSPTGLVLDTTDIDDNGTPDLWAGLGIITDSGTGVISSTYHRGNPNLRLKTPLPCAPGDRLVPAVHYTCTTEGLKRNGILIAEAITSFIPRFSAQTLTIHLEATRHDQLVKLHTAFTLSP